jgi:NADH dehydrogenase
VSINPETKTVTAADGNAFAYDYLLITCGSETNFFGNSVFKKNAQALDTVNEATTIREKITAPDLATIVISGGGYTALETATHIRKYLCRRHIQKKILLIELADTLLKPMPAWIQTHVQKTLIENNIEYALNEQITDIQGSTVMLKSGTSIPQALVVWAAGVVTPTPIQNLPFKKDRQGRLVTDQYLRVHDSIFVAGDCAHFDTLTTTLRMSVRFAVDEGRCVAHNIIREGRGKRLQPFRPFDPGYIVPLADKNSCGIALSIPVKGLLATLLHYFLCILLNYGLKKRLLLLKNATKTLFST